MKKRISKKITTTISSKTRVVTMSQLMARSSGRKGKQAIIKPGRFGFKLNWRMVWYSVLVWLVAIIIAGFVILPWFYLVLPLVVFTLTIRYFRRDDKSFEKGLWIALSWFFVVAVLDFFEIIGWNYSNALIYFSDSRQWLKYPIILLVPIIYSLIGESRVRKRKAGLGVGRLRVV